MALDVQAHWRQESQGHTCLYSDFKGKFFKGAWQGQIPCRETLTGQLMNSEGGA